MKCDFLQTRILSVFNLLKRVGFAVLLLTTTIMFAQEVLWQRDGDLETSRFGSGLFPLGDQNDDGFADWAVYNSDVNGSVSPWLSGLDFFYGGNPPSQEPYLRIQGRGGEASLTWREYDFGDFNGDGYTDWVITFNPGTPAPADSMYFYFYGGGPNADTIPELIWGIDGFDFFIRSSRLRSIGDHNGDGKDDFYYYDPYPSDLTYIYLGNANWNFEVNLINQGEPIDSGESMPSPGVFGDFNGDGYDDYPTVDAGVTKYYWGSSHPDTIPDFAFNYDGSSHTVMNIDLTGDGRDEMVSDLGSAGVDVFLGSEFPSGTPTAQIHYESCTNGAFSLQTAGDINDDGYEDLVIANSVCNNGFGRMIVFAGGHYVRETPIWLEEGTSSGLLVGIWRAIGLGDINGDEIDDLAVGCQRGSNLRGRVVIFSGDTTLHVDASEHRPLAEDFSMSVFPNPFNSTLSISLDVPLHQEVRLGLYDLLGREVDVVYRGRLESATLSYSAPASLASGIYFVRAATVHDAVMQKVVLLK